MNNILLMLHFIGLAMAFSAPFGNIIVGGLIKNASPEGAAALAKFPARIANVAWGGFGLLVVTGPIMIYTKYDGAWSELAWTFWVKIAAVLILLALAFRLTQLERQVAGGDKSAASMMERLGPMAGGVALLVIVFAVLTFK